MTLSGKQVLVFTAHPDDEVQAAGTLAKLSQQGNDIYLVVATEGDKGTHDLAVRPQDIAAVRKQEMAEAAAVLGLKDVLWLGFADGSLEHRLEELKERVFRVIRQRRPDIVITFDGWRRWDPHSDHRTIGQVATEAAYLADGPWYYPEHAAEGLRPHRTAETYLFGSEEPNHVVDIHATYDLKVQAAACHRSQWGAHFNLTERIAARLKAQGLPDSARFEETFRRIRDEGLSI